MTTQQTTDAPALSPALEHFLDLAFRGRIAGSSGGEKRCRRIAKVILDNSPGLDGDALQGMAEFIRVAVRQPETTRTVLKLWD